MRVKLPWQWDVHPDISPEKCIVTRAETDGNLKPSVFNFDSITQYWVVDACKPGLVSAALVKAKLVFIDRKSLWLPQFTQRGRKNDCHACLLLPDLSHSVLCIYAVLPTLCYTVLSVLGYDMMPVLETFLPPQGTVNETLWFPELQSQGSREKTKIRSLLFSCLPSAGRQFNSLRLTVFSQTLSFTWGGEEN